MKLKIFSALLAVAILIGFYTVRSNNYTAEADLTQQTVTVSSAETPAKRVLSISANLEPALQTKPKLGIKYARNFNIDYLTDGLKLVTDSDGNKLLLTPKGVNRPSGYDDATLVETPITRAMYSSTTYVGLIGALEDESLYDSVAIVTTGEDGWTIPQILERFKSGVTLYVKHGSSSVGNIEEIIGINPDFVFTGGNDESDMQLRCLLDEIGIKHATLLEWTEEGHLANLEWIKFFAAFFNLDEKADRIFEEKIAYLDELYEKSAGIPDKPTVAYGLVWNGKVYTQSGTSTLARQIEKAGGVYALTDIEGTGSVTITMEEFLNKCRDADILIYGSLLQNCPDKAYLLGIEPLMAEFSAFKNDRIFVFGYGYYMNNAKVVEKFKDMLAVFHPDMFPDYELVVYQKLPD